MPDTIDGTIDRHAIMRSLMEHNPLKYEREPQLLHADAGLFVMRLKIIRQDATPMVGDFVRMPAKEGEGVFRIAHRWTGYTAESVEDKTISSLQPAGALKGGSYYLGLGYASYSGSLKRIVNMRLVDSKEFQAGDFWVASGDYHAEGRGVTATVPCRVWVPR